MPSASGRPARPGPQARPAAGASPRASCNCRYGHGASCPRLGRCPRPAAPLARGAGWAPPAVHDTRRTRQGRTDPRDPQLFPKLPNAGSVGAGWFITVSRTNPYLALIRHRQTSARPAVAGAVVFDEWVFPAVPILFWVSKRAGVPQTPGVPTALETPESRALACDPSRNRSLRDPRPPCASVEPVSSPSRSVRPRARGGHLPGSAAAPWPGGFWYLRLAVARRVPKTRPRCFRISRCPWVPSWFLAMSTGSTRAWL